MKRRKKKSLLYLTKRDREWEERVLKGFELELATTGAAVDEAAVTGTGAGTNDGDGTVWPPREPRPPPERPPRPDPAALTDDCEFAGEG